MPVTRELVNYIIIILQNTMEVAFFFFLIISLVLIWNDPEDILLIENQSSVWNSGCTTLPFVLKESLTHS